MKLSEILSKLQYGTQWQALNSRNGKKICSSYSTEELISEYRDSEVWAMSTVMNCQKGNKSRMIEKVTPVLCIFIHVK